MPRSSILATLLLLPLTASAETPNIQPGEWEYTHSVRMEGVPQMPGMGEQPETTRECVTRDSLRDRPDGFFESPENCVLDEAQVRSDGADVTMTCTNPMGDPMTVEGEMVFMGNQSSGVMTTQTDTPMGPITIVMNVEGRRVGDC